MAPLYNSPASYGSKTSTQFEGGTGSHGATLNDGPLPTPVADRKVTHVILPLACLYKEANVANKTAPATITVTQERVDIKAETVEDSTISHKIKVNGCITHGTTRFE
jgi:hypothetical protein